MANLTSALNDQIRRLSRREINGQTRSTRKLSTQHRRDIAELKRQVSELTKRQRGRVFSYRRYVKELSTGTEPIQ